jgi:hypothetical protein
MTIDDKIESAVHAALMAMGISVGNNISFAIDLSEWLYSNATDHITGDHDDE